MQFGGVPPPPGEVFRFTGSQTAVVTKPTIDATVFSGRKKEG